MMMNGTSLWGVDGIYAPGLPGNYTPTLQTKATCPAWASSVYLNGVDISGAMNQDLKGVDVHINNMGNVFLSAPKYYVH